MIRDSLRLLEDREKLRTLKLESLRAETQQGINSGAGRPLEDVAGDLKARYRQWAEQGSPSDAL